MKDAVQKALDAGWVPKAEGWAIVLTRFPLGADTIHIGNVVNDPLSGQSPETLDFIAKLLKD